MKLFIVLCIAALAVAAPPSSGREAQLLRYENENIGVGGYRFAFEQDDGTAHRSQGEVRNEGREDEFLAVTGEYSWIAPNGIKYIVRYTADDNGYNADVEEGPGVPGPIVASLLG